MRKRIDTWYSPNLNKNMEIVEYGHYGPALLLLPTAAADYLEYERFQMINALSKYINEGRIKVYSINSINNESWLNNKINGRDKSVRHNQFNQYVYEEVVPYIKGRTSEGTPIITSGASFGALHSANLFFKNPWAISGCIAMSGLYDLGVYTKSYWDDECHWNSPLHYLKQLSGEHLSQIRKSPHIHVLAGSGNYEDPDGSRYLSGTLSHLGIDHRLDIWGHDIDHDWPTWRKMLPYILEKNF